MGGVLDLCARAAGVAPSAERNSAAGAARSVALPAVATGATAPTATATAVVPLNDDTDLADRVAADKFAAAVVLPGTVPGPGVLALAASPAARLQLPSSAGLATAVSFAVGANCLQFINAVGTGLDGSGGSLRVGARGRPAMRRAVEDKVEAPNGFDTVNAPGGGLDGVVAGR